MMRLSTQSSLNQKNGFALLFTVLIVSLILSIAIGIANLTLKQALLSNLVKDSQAAFYQADSAVECGIYQDIVIGAFSLGSISPDASDLFSPDTVMDNIITETTPIALPNLSPGDTIIDDVSPIRNTPVAPPRSFFCGSTLMELQSNKDASSIFTYRPASPIDGAPCFTIVFDKSNAQIQTKIQGYGYNVCAATPRQVERAIEVTY